MKKGISLPVNMLVILAVAVIVLLALVAFFMGGFETGAIEDRNKINMCCGPVSTFQYCNEGSWSSELTGLSCDAPEDSPVSNADVCVQVGGEWHDCSSVIPGGPGNCPACMN